MPRALAALAFLWSAAAVGAGGPPVVSVRIAESPEIAQRLQRHLSEITEGVSLDPEAVRHVVELLHATGEYEDVVVETAPAAGGVEVTFRLVPAPLFREVVVEGDRVLSAKAVRRLARLRPHEPLWSSRLETAARDVALALVQKGYLEARVTAGPVRRDDGADAVFVVQAGPLVRVGRARVEGAPRGLQGALDVLVRPSPGEVFERARAQKSAEDMRKALVKAGRWQAEAQLQESYDPRTARMEMAFAVAAGPRVEVRYEGAVPSSGLRGTVRDLLREGRVKTDVLEEAADRIGEALRQEGHRTPVVRHREEEQGGLLNVTYVVEPGPRSRASAVRIEGEDVPPLPEVSLLTRPGQPVRSDWLLQDVQALTRALEDAGHATARVEADVPEGGGDVPVVFRVRPGPRTRVAGMSVDSLAALPPDSPPQELRLREGGPYRVADLARDRQTIETAYRNAGFLQAEVTPETVFSEKGDEVRVAFHVRPGLPTRVDHVVIAGLGETKEEVVRRELLIKEGEPLGLQRVLETQRRLGALGLFGRITITEMDPESPETRSVVVRAEEAPPLSVVAGVGYAERDLGRASVEVTRRNLFGMDRRISLFTRISFRGLRIVTAFREPYLFGRKQELFVTAFREEEEDRADAFDFIRHGLTFQTSRTLNPRWNLILRETYQRTRTFNLQGDCLLVDRAFCPGTISGPSASLVNDTRDDPVDPRRGHLLLTDAQLSLGVLGGDSLAKGFVQAATYQLLNARTLVALSGRVGLARTFDEAEPKLPAPDRFFAGGDYSLRGFRVDRVRPDGGNGLLLGGAELRMKAVGDLWVAAFADAGNVYRLVSDMSLSDLRYSAGLGLRYRSAVGPLRVDWGYKLDRRPEEKAYEFHITVGHAF